jgi:hypothetical protein
MPVGKASAGGPQGSVGGGKAAVGGTKDLAAASKVPAHEEEDATHG